MADGEHSKGAPMLRMAVDYGPLLVFFAVNYVTPGPNLARVIAATVAFMIATVAALLFSKLRLGSVSPMLWITAVLVIGFGSLTVYFQDQKFIQMKPSFVYSLFGGVLLFGLVTGRPLLQQLFATAYPGLDSEGWRKLTRNWAIFFIAMAALNEAVWRGTLAYLGQEAGWTAWLWFKMPGCVIITLVFAIANIPMLLKHGLTLVDEKPADAPPKS